MLAIHPPELGEEDDLAVVGEVVDDLGEAGRGPAGDVRADGGGQAGGERGDDRGAGAQFGQGPAEADRLAPVRRGAPSRQAR